MKRFIEWLDDNMAEIIGTVFTIVVIGIAVAVIAAATVGCREADRASYNISREADNFNIVRRVTVIDCINGDVLFRMEGRMSIYADTRDNQLEITVEDVDGKYQKHIIGLSDNVTYVVEDLNLGKNAVSNFKYTIIYNPKMWLPVEVKTEK